MADPLVPNNPYVGPRSIETGEALFGRDREIRSLSGLLIAERIVLLHSPSGAGKSSLIQAGLRPRMQARFNVLPLVRVNQELPPEVRPQAGVNRYLLSTLLSLEEDLPIGKRLPLAVLTGLSLDAYLEQRPQVDGIPENILLLFDQFEEVLTVSASDAPAKQEFFEQLGEALQNRRRWALFAIREDYIGGLAPYVRAIPNRLGITYRLALLGPQAAKLAIQLPARDKQVDFTDQAAQKLVDDLRLIQAQQPDGSFSPELGAEVEPVQLQVVCFNLWQSHAADDKIIDENDLQRVGSVDQALANYYANAIHAVAESARVSERVLRLWVDEHLLTPDGIRSQVLKGSEQSAGLPNSAVRLLENAHLLRGETRAGKTWYELSHDRLVQPVRQDNTAWFAFNLRMIQRQAALWNKRGRGEELLLYGRDLAKAQKEIRGIPLTEAEQDFLKASLQFNLRKQRDRRSIFITVMLVVSMISLILSIYLGIQSLSANANLKVALDDVQAQKGTAEANAAVAATAQADAETGKLQALALTSISRARELALQAVNARDKNFAVSLLLGVEAFNVQDLPQSREVLLDNTQANLQLNKFVGRYAHGVLRLAISPDGKTLAALLVDNSVVVRELATAKTLVEFNIGPSLEMAFSPDGGLLATQSLGGEILLWDLATGKQTGQISTDPSEVPTRLAFSPDGKLVASANDDGLIWLVDVTNRKLTGKLVSGHSDKILAMSFSPDGKTLSSGSQDDSISLWDLGSQQRLGSPLKGHTDLITSLAFSHDGKMLASGSGDHNIILWSMASHLPVGPPLTGHTDWITSLAFSQDGKTLASASADYTILLWNVATGTPSSPALRGHTGRVTSLVFNPQDGGKTLLSGSDDQSIILWNVLPAQSIARALTGHTGAVTSLAFSQDNKRLVSGSYDKTILQWNLADGQPGAPLTGHTDIVSSVAFSPLDGGKTLLSASQDYSLMLWDTTSGRRIDQSPMKDNNPAVGAAFSPLDGGKSLVSVGVAGDVIVWDTLSQQIISQQSIDDPSAISSVAFSPDGKIAALGNQVKSIYLWDIVAKKLTGQALLGHSDKVTSLAFSPLDGGKTLASGSDDKTIILWDVASGQQVGQALSGQTEGINGLVFSPDGKTLASSSWDGSIMLWDLTTRQTTGQLLTGSIGAPTSLAFSPDGSTLASGTQNGPILLWNLNPQSWINDACARANRNLTRVEWGTYFPGEAYRATCAQFPLEAEATPTPDQ